ncbi:hypothetical protein Ancab_008797 [Ancistrocladus abbreviatus]
MAKKRFEAEDDENKEAFSQQSNEKLPNISELANGDGAKKKKMKKRDKVVEEDRRKCVPTVSIAISGSIIDNALSLELATLVLLSLWLSVRSYGLAGQITRAATIFRVDELQMHHKTQTLEIEVIKPHSPPSDSILAEATSLTKPSSREVCCLPSQLREAEFPEKRAQSIF